jgi:ubiquinone/menaquinone biosynthesis C-methylase UbiE
MATDRTAVSATRGEVPEAFDEVADRYDLMVALNPGYHAHLRHSARSLVAGLVPGLGSRIVDLGCGSGASTRALVDELNRAGVRAEVLGVDGSAGMLTRAGTKSWPSWVRFEQARAEALEEVCADAGFQPLDGVFAAYLLRNVPDRDALLRSLHDLLRPGGTLVVHEYSVAGRPVA